MASLCDDAIQAVPLDLRDAGRALGGTQLALVRHVVLPNALAGVGAAAFLGIARALGETMIVLVACGLQPSLTFDPLAAVETLSAFLGSALLSDAGATEAGAAQLFFVAMVLFAVTFVLNSVSARWRARYMRGAA
jgi:phosphate transport system permease protein